MATLNVGMKVNRAISGATTVSANAYAMVTYISGTIGTNCQYGLHTQGNVTTRTFGPGQSIPASFTTSARVYIESAGFSVQTVTWSIQSGVELINTI